MKKLTIVSIGIAATLALTAPTWAQTSNTTPPAPSPAPAGKRTGGMGTSQGGAPGASATPAASPPMAGKKTGGGTRHSHGTHNASGMSEAERLNADELQQLRMNSPAATSTAPGGNNPTSGAAGPFAPK